MWLRRIYTFSVQQEDDILTKRLVNIPIHRKDFDNFIRGRIIDSGS